MWREEQPLLKNWIQEIGSLSDVVEIDLHATIIHLSITVNLRSMAKRIIKCSAVAKEQGPFWIF